MNPTLYDLLLVLLSALISWLLTHRYYLKSLKTQETEASREINELLGSLKKSSSNDINLQKNKFIESAVEYWKRNGQPITYINSIPDISDKSKADIFHSACLRHKGRAPKHNPYS